MLWNGVLFVFLLLMTPKLLIERIRGKKHPHFFQRLGFFLPKIQNVIWIHAVSVGEVKAAVPLFRKIKQEWPEERVLITTTTATGQEEAKRSLSEADAICYLPFDFSWVVRRFVKQICPKLLLLIEGDIWPNLLKVVQKQGGEIVLVSGKLSAKSAARLSLIPSLAKRLFAPFKLLCLQNEEYAKRFVPFILDASKIKITGNLKFDLEPQAFTPISITSKHPFITISCTHAREEERILDCLEAASYTVFLAPRHPERFCAVAELLRRKNIPFVLLSRIQDYQGYERVILVDAMGRLSACYAISQLAIVGGSFIPNIGGHNILEPCLYGCPVLFGPYAFAQRELVQKVVSNQAGRQVTFESLSQSIAEMIASREFYAEKALLLSRESRGSTLNTWHQILQCVKTKNICL